MAIDKVREFFENLGMSERILEFPVSSATVELAAEAVGCEPQRIAKTLSFSVNGEPVLIVTSGDCKIDNHKFKERFHQKASMLSYDDVEGLIGHGVGGVCPFAVNDGVKIYLDVSLKRFEIIYPAAGSANSAVKLSPDELERCSGGEWIDVCKGWER